jgi:hypothetical protein
MTYDVGPTTGGGVVLSLTHFDESATGEAYEGTIGEPLFTTDGAPLRWYLERRRTSVEVYQTATEELDPAAAADRSETLLPGASARHRYVVDVSVAGLMPSGNHVFLNVSLRLGGHHPPIEVSIPYRLDDDPVRLTSWASTMETIGRDPLITQWLVGHQGPMDDPTHGVFVQVDYIDRAWTLTFYGSANTRRMNLVVRAPIGDANAPLDVHEVEPLPYD